MFFVKFFLFFHISTLIMDCSDSVINVNLFQKNYQNIMIYGNSKEITEIRGFQNENHAVETNDGYILSLFRIRKPQTINTTISNRISYPFIILHGLFSDSESFQRASDGFYLKDTQSYVEFENQFLNRLDTECNFKKMKIGRMLAFHLAACGYDVWLMNVRDSPEYSRHKIWNKKIDFEFWNTTLDSYTEDLRSVLSYVLLTSGSKTSALLCHSAGCSTAFQLMIDHQETNSQLFPLFLLAPYIFTGKIFSTLILSSYLEPIFRDYMAPTWSFRRASEVIVESMSGNEWLQRLYGSLFSFLGGFNMDEFDWNRIDRIAAHIPGTAASRLVSHVGQRRDQNRFSRFDYQNKEDNLRAYHCVTPPEYDLSKITNKHMILFTGLYDTISPFPSIEQFKRNLKVPLLSEIRTPNSHMDFIFGRNVNSTVNLRVFQWLQHLNL